MPGHEPRLLAQAFITGVKAAPDLAITFRVPIETRIGHGSKTPVFG